VYTGKRLAVLVFGLEIYLLAGLAASVHGEGRSPVAQATALDERLVRIGIQLFRLNRQVPDLFAKTFRDKHSEAGEGLYAVLFNDAITVLKLAIEQNQKNVLAHYYLGESYYAKSYEGEGTWARALLVKAEEHFSFVVTQASRQPVPREILTKSQNALKELRQTLQESN
jgi:hypothetical protein